MVGTLTNSNIILQAEVGSTAWGLSLLDDRPCEPNPVLSRFCEKGTKCCSLHHKTADSDQMGVIIEPFAEAMGIGDPFEQQIKRTAAERDGTHNASSKAGDIDLVLYSLRKWMRLALKGNPTILTLLFVPQEKWLAGHALGGHLQDLAPRIVSKQAGKAFLGYLQAQRMRLTGEKGGSHGAVHSLDQEKFGYDTKYAMHMLRLGYQGIELLSTGRMSMPMSDEPREILLDVRRGKSDIQNVLTLCGDLERQLKDLMDTSPLPAKPDTQYVEDWMLETYYRWWRAVYGGPITKIVWDRMGA